MKAGSIARADQIVVVTGPGPVGASALLSVLDRKWRDHLYEMDYLKEGIGLRAVAQRDPAAGVRIRLARKATAGPTWPGRTHRSGA